MSTLPSLTPLASLPLPGAARTPEPVAPIAPGTPILPSLPSAQTAFTRKYTDPSLQQALQQLPESLRKSLIDFDQQRVNRGQQPLSAAQTLAALQTVQQNKAATPAESQGFLQRLASDVRGLIDVPHIISGLVSEAQQLPEAPGKLSEVLGRGDIQSIVGGLQEVPGVRLIPGVYTASTVANEGPGGLLTHPLYTALDVLPYAKPAIGAVAESTLSRIPRVAEARAALDITAENAARDAIGLKPIKEPSAARLAARTSPTLNALRTTPLAQHLAVAFGAQAGDIVQLGSHLQSELRTQADVTTPITHPSVTPEIAPIREAIAAANEWQNLIPESRRIDLTRAMEQDAKTVLSDPTLSDTERAFVQGQIDHAQALADFSIRRGWLPERIDGEVFDRTQAPKILASRRRLARVEAINSARQMVEQPVIGERPAIDTSTLLSEHLNKDLKYTLAKSYAHAIDAAGLNAEPIFGVLRSGNIEAIKSMIDGVLESPEFRPYLSQSELLDTLRPLTRSDPSYARLYADIKRGNYAQALDTFRNTLGSRKRHVHAQSAEILDSLLRGRDREKFLASTEQFSSKVLDRVKAKNAKVEAAILPARFVPIAEKLRGERLYEMFSSDAEAQGLIEKGFHHLVEGVTPELLRTIDKDVVATVQEMRANGIDPVFVHRVSPSQVPSINYPSLTDALRTPTQVRARTMDATPYVQDAAVATSHAGVELLSRLASERFVDHFIDMYGKTQRDVLAPYVQRGIEANLRDPSLTPAQHAEQMMQREWAKYDPTALFPGQTPRLGSFPKNTEIYIPKTAQQVLTKMFHDHGFKFSAVLDPVMNLFRMNVLAFAPRFHINNIGGGAMLLATEEPATLLNLRRARDFVKSGEYDKVHGLPPSGLGSQPRDIIEWSHKASFTDKVLAAHSYKAGQTLARWMEQAQPITSKIKAGADWSYKWNGKVDDMYRAAAFLTGQDKALAKGMTARQAEQAGVALVRKILPEWDRITPFERNVVRSVFPFYSFAKFVTQYALRYPMDHPFRVSVASSIARNEMEDFGDALPLQFASMFFLGHPDKNGNVSALNVGALNPFQDVANYFTLSGYTGKVNPIISSVLEAVGVDPSKGAQDLYPDISYDPVTGKLKPSNPSFLSSLISNVIPQSDLITALIGHNQNFNQILRTNPEAAAALLRSQAGLPNIFRTVNPSQEAFKAELQRETNQTNVKNEALRTGDYSRANNFPALRAYFQQITQLMGKSPNVFQPYVPESLPGSSVTEALSGLVRNNIP